MRLLLTLSLLFLSTPLWGASRMEAEVLHWWIWPSERKALDIIISSFQDNGGIWTDTPVEYSWQARAAALSRIRDGNSPTAMQWHIGKQTQKLYSLGILHRLDEVDDHKKWRQVLPSHLWRFVTVDEQIVAVPVALHGANWLWANVRVLNDCKLTMPKNWDELLAMGPKIRKKGYIPLALGGQPWQETFVFLSLALAIGGRDFYTKAFDYADYDTLKSATMAAIFEKFGELRSLIDEDSPGRSWGDTATLMIDGRAAFHLMGDWVKGEFLQAGMKIGEDIICGLAPGTEEHYIGVPDSFAFPLVTDKQQKKAQQLLAQTIMNPDVQRRFSLIKGSIPARIDISTDGFDKCAQIAMGLVRNKRNALVSGLDMIDQEVVASSLMTAVSTYWNDPAVSPRDAANNLAVAVRDGSF